MNIKVTATKSFMLSSPDPEYSDRYEFVEFQLNLPKKDMTYIRPKEPWYYQFNRAYLEFQSRGWGLKT